MTIATDVVNYTLLDSNAATQALKSGQSVHESFIISATDGRLNASVDVVFSISGANDAPTIIAADQSPLFTEMLGADTKANAVVINGALTVGDLDGQVTGATVTITNVKAGDELEFSDTVKIHGSYADGVLTLIAISSQGATTEDFESALESVRFNNKSDTPDTTARTIEFKVSDGVAISVAATETVVVAATNDTPTPVGTLISMTQSDNTAVTITTAEHFNDVDIDNLFTYSAEGLPTGLSINALTGVISGNLSHDASQGVTSGVYSVVVTATDSQNAAVTQSFTFAVTNPAPVAHADTGAVDENAAISINKANGIIMSSSVTAGTDTDVDGDTLTVIGVNVGSAADVVAVGTSNVATSLAGTYGLLTLSADGSYSYVADTAAAEALIQGVTAIDTFSYAISDGNGGTSFATLKLSVKGLNDVFLSVADVTVSEGAGTATFTVTRSGDIHATATIDYTTSDGTAKSLSDYTAASATLHFATGETSQPITVAITDDKLFEGSELFNISLLNPDSGTSLIDNFAVATIKDDDASNNLPTVTSLTITGKDDVSEGSNAIFTVSLNAVSSSATAITVTPGAVGDGATLGVDYSNALSAYSFDGNTKTTLPLTNGLLSLPAGLKSFMVSVPTINDTHYEGAEWFTLGAVLAGGQISSDTATILDDGTGQIYDEQGNITGQKPDDDGFLLIPDVTVNEHASYVVFRVQASSNYSFTFSLQDGGTDYTVGDAVATLGADYGNSIEVYNGTTWMLHTTDMPLNVPVGGSVLLVRVPVFDDVVYEGAHAFTLIATPSGDRDPVKALGIIGDFGTGAVFNTSGAEDRLALKDDDRTIKVDSPIVNEGSDYSLFTVTGAPGAITLALQVESGDGKATIPSGNDNIQFWNGASWVTYDGSNALLSESDANPETLETLLVRVAITAEQDLSKEGSETFMLKVSKVVESQNVESFGVTTIRDDGTGVIYTFDGVNGAYSGTTTAGLDDDFDHDGITPTTEEALATLAASQGIGDAQIGDMNGDGKDDATQNALATLAWTSKDYFEQGNSGTLTESKAIISIGVVESTTDSTISETSQLLNIVVEKYSEIDSTTTVIEKSNDNGTVTNTVTLVDGTEVTTPWDPIRFEIAGKDDGTVAPELTDIDNMRPGTQVKVLIDVRASGLTTDDANAYIKYVSAEAIAAIPSLLDLHGTPITKAGWYDFTRLDPQSDNDGARFVVEDGKIVGIELILTDNAFGDNDPDVGRIYDPGVMVKVTTDLVTPHYNSDQTPGKVDFYGVTTGGVALKAWHNPITGDYFYAPEGTPLPYECYEPSSSDLGRVLEASNGVFDVHLYLNSAGDTQIMGESAAAALGLPAQGYADKGAIFASANATALDVVVPTVDTFSPTDNATNAPVGNDIVLTFSEDITRGSGTIAIHTGSVDGAVVAATVSAAGKRLTINPDSDLSPDTHYVVTLADGSVMDLAGNHYNGTSAYDFTTDSLGADPYAGGGSHDGGTGVVLGGIAALGVIAWLAL